MQTDSEKPATMFYFPSIVLPFTCKLLPLYEVPHPFAFNVKLAIEHTVILEVNSFEYSAIYKKVVSVAE